MATKLTRLKRLFVGNWVRITHTHNRAWNTKGICKAVHSVPGDRNFFDLELKNGSRFNFNPEIVDLTSVDGKLSKITGDQRKIEVIAPPPRHHKK